MVLSEGFLRGDPFAGGYLSRRSGEDGVGAGVGLVSGLGRTSDTIFVDNRT